MIQAVTILGDLLRPKGDGTQGEVDRITLWLFDAIHRSIALAANLTTEPLTTPALAPWIDSLRTSANADAHWASIHDRLNTDPAPILQRLKNRFCVGYETPPWLARLLTEHDIPWIDIRLHPIRFMDDLMFAVAGQTQAALQPLAVPESEIIVTASLRQAMCRYISEAAVPANTLLIAGQRRFDSTQIVSGTFFDAMDHAPDIYAIAARYKAAILKPHPLDPHHSLMTVAAGAPTRMLGVINDNAYRMLSLPQIEAILTVNSGLAYEAPYFGKRVHTLAPLTTKLAWRESPPAPNTHLAMDDVVLTPDFWRIVLAPHTSVTPADGMRLKPKPNRLRIALDSFWNYQQIDTDRIPRG